MSSATTEPPADTRSAPPPGSLMGLRQATALIVGSIIGVGIFNLPGSLSAYGPITLLSMALVTVGALALALLFAALSRRLPADGGPYAYARAAFGNGIGFANAWSYWITAWAGNAAIVTGWVLYVEYLLTKGGANPPLAKWALIVLALIGLWLPALINLNGVAGMASVQVVTTILKFAAAGGRCRVIGLFFINTGELPPVERRPEGRTSPPIGTGLALGLFSYLGVEMRRGRRGQGPRPGPERAPGEHLRHARVRRRLPAVAVRGLRRRADARSCRSPTPRSPPP